MINGIVLWLADWFLDRLVVDGFLWAMAGGLFLAVFNLLLRPLLDRDSD